MDTDLNATDSDDWEHILPPDDSFSRRPSLAVNNAFVKPAASGLEKDISFFDLLHDHTQTQNLHYADTLYYSQNMNTIHDTTSKLRIAAASLSPVGLSADTYANSSAAKSSSAETELHRRKPTELTATFDTSPERPVSSDVTDRYDPNSLRSSIPHTVEPYTQQVSSPSQNTGPSQLDPSYRVQKGSFFTPGRVFKVLFSEAASFEPSKRDRLANLSTMLSNYITTDTDLMGRCSDHVIPGLLDSQHTVDATGDTGAKYNFLNETYAKRCNFKIDSTSRRPITIASGQKVMTTGISEVSFCFRGEQTPYPLKFHILPGCVKNVILGRSFLKATKTFSNALHFAKRVVKRFVRTLNTHQVLFLGASPPMFAGLLNGETKTALADSASKVLIMDEDYARMLGLSIVSTKKTCIKLRFADGSTAFTSGKTYNVSWQFGTGKRYPLDFYILKNAPADVILSEDFLLRETKAFIEYAHCLMEEDEDEDIGYYEDSGDDDYFFAIYREDNYHPQAYTEGADQYFEDDREDSRREAEDLLIDSLIGTEKDVAIAKAQARRAQWAANRVANTFAQGGQGSTTNTASSSATPQLQTSNTAGMPSTSKRSRWRFKLIKKRKSGQTGLNP